MLCDPSPVPPLTTAASTLFQGMILSQLPTDPTSNSQVTDFSLRQRSVKHRMDVNTSQRRQSKQSFVKAHYHPFLFATMAFSAMAELGLTAFLVSAGNENNTWPSPRYHSLCVDDLSSIVEATYMYISTA
jgi:hypothetical protein